MGVDPVTVRRWESGLREPSEKHLYGLAVVYDLNVELLLKAISAPTERTKHDIGLWLNELRLMRDLSLERAASMVGIPPEVLLSYENGLVDSDPRVMKKIARAYKTSLGWAVVNIMGVAIHKRQNILDTPRPSSYQRVIPIKGIVMAGIPRDRYDVEYGNIGWPDISPIGHYPGAFALVVSGDECASDGIHDLDLVFVEPGGYQGFPADIGSTDIGKLHVVRIDGIPLICRVIAEGVLRSSDGGVQRFEASKMEILGKVAFHLRRIQ